MVKTIKPGLSSNDKWSVQFLRDEIEIIKNIILMPNIPISGYLILIKISLLFHLTSRLWQFFKKSKMYKLGEIYKSNLSKFLVKIICIIYV